MMLKNNSLFQNRTASEITHELKTPLTVIEGAHDVLLGEFSDGKPDMKKVQDYLAMIDQNSRRLRRFIGEILDYDRLDGKSFSKELEVVDLQQLWSEVLEEYTPSHGRVRLESAKNPTVIGYREGLRRIAQNLLSNSVRFCPEDDILISIRVHDNRIETSVEDRGIGIPKDKLTKIFEPFVRLGNDPDELKRGSGLGLAIAKRWVEFHNGFILAESKGPGHGAKITYTLSTNAINN
jgi:signal transduction histidine kinase